MSGEKNLAQLLKTMQPELNAGEFVFCVVQDLVALEGRTPLMTFREKEGMTVILPREVADQLRLEYSFVAAWITLTVHSSLEAVGLTAAFSTALGDQGISCNVVAGFYHDHLFVDRNDAQKAMEVLRKLSDGV